MTFRIAFAALSLSTLCAASGPASAVDLSQALNGTNVGTLGGAVVGGIGGNYLAKKAKLGEGGKVAATIGGTIAGGVLGNVVGQKLDDASRQRATYAQQRALETGSTENWQGQQGSGTWGKVKPGNPYKAASGICRDYSHTIFVQGRNETTRGVACRNPDGTWRIQS